MAQGSWGRRWARIIKPEPRAEVEEELAFHLEARVRANMEHGMNPDEARAAAEARLGNLDGVRRECTDLLRAERREEARREWMKVSWLDFKVGFRMLVKYPVLTLVGGMAIAFAIWVGAGTFEFVSQLLFPTLPLDGGDRIVGIDVQDVAGNRTERRVIHDFVTWREELSAVSELGAFREVERNLITGDGRGEPVELAEISAAGFRVARTPPLLGRVLVQSDEEPGATPVAVIGHDVWQNRFAADPEIIGHVIRLGAQQTTIVGVMPEDFGFPVAQHMWVPLRLNPLDYERGGGPSLRVFGRLTDGTSLEEAQAELTALGQRAAADYPETHEHLRPRVQPYAHSILGLSGLFAIAGISSINFVALLLLLLICSNVALLMFARAATRENELVVRSALGASRGRIITQLFAESLVLGGLAALVGLVAASAGLKWGLRIVETAILDGQRLPFWVDASLSPATLLYAVLLTLLVAVITGVVPALKVTGKGVGARLRQASAGGGGFRFGGVWTVVIVTQVAVTVALPVMAISTRVDAARMASIDVGFPTEQYLSASIAMDREPPPGSADTSQAAFALRYRASLEALEQRLEAERAVTAVTFAERLPLMYHPHRRIEVDGGGAPMSEQEIRGYGDPVALGYRVSSASVALDFFETLDAPILTGRAFHSGDLAGDANVIIVNETFVRRVLGGRNALGQRIRYRFFEERRGDPTYDPEAEPWYEIVGVVRDMGTTLSPSDFKNAGIYHPTALGSDYPANAAIHVNGDAPSFAPRVRTLAAAVNPALRLYGVEPLGDVVDVEIDFMTFWFRLILMLTIIALVLSLAGIYAVTAYTVARRTREIGIRVALGADARRIVLAIFRRPLIQVTTGVILGAALTGTLMVLASGTFSLHGAAMVAAYAVFMLGVCLIACVVPTRRALGVQPTEAMRTEG